MTQQHQLFLDKCHELVEFCEMHKGRYCFQLWPKEILLLYIAWNALHGCLFLHRTAGRVDAVGFAMPDNYERIEAMAAKGMNVFNWRLNPWPDCIFVAEVIGTREHCKKFLADAKKQWPKYSRYVTFRRGTLVDLDLNKFAGGEA